MELATGANAPISTSGSGYSGKDESGLLIRGKFYLPHVNVWECVPPVRAGFFYDGFFSFIPVFLFGFFTSILVLLVFFWFIAIMSFSLLSFLKS
jgi:hypothetical protein